MPLEQFSGPVISDLLAEAKAAIGADAVVLTVRRTRTSRGRGFELTAADPATAAVWSRSPQPIAVPPERTSMSPLDSGRARGGSPGPLVIALVGPTGAGKTTTIAKLANHPQVFGGLSVGLVSLDTYRIGAVEQSRIYAELSRVPLEIVYEATEIPRVLTRLRDCEVILVDTAGRGPRSRDDASATQAQLRWLRPAEVHLTLPVGLQSQLARRWIADFRPFGVTHVIVTKVDECPRDRTIFHLAVECGLPMRWIADGQEVPGDLRSAAAPPADAAASPAHEPGRFLAEVA